MDAEYTECVWGEGMKRDESNVWECNLSTGKMNYSEGIN